MADDGCMHRSSGARTALVSLAHRCNREGMYFLLAVCCYLADRMN